MDTQPTEARRERQAVPIALSQSKQSKRPAPTTEPAVSRAKAERSRKATLKRQREQFGRNLKAGECVETSDGERPLSEAKR
jgi:hypothetical protein